MNLLGGNKDIGSENNKFGSNSVVDSETKNNEYSSKLNGIMSVSDLSNNNKISNLYRQGKYKFFSKFIIFPQNFNFF